MLVEMVSRSLLNWFGTVTRGHPFFYELGLKGASHRYLALHGRGHVLGPSYPLQQSRERMLKDSLTLYQS